MYKRQPGSTVTTAQGGFTADDDNIGRWVQRSVDNTVILVAVDARPLGVITRFSSGKVAVAVGKIVRGKRGANTILVGSRVTGVTRQESATGSAERGFVGPGKSTTAAEVSASDGYVISQDATTTNNTPAGYVDVVMR